MPDFDGMSLSFGFDLDALNWRTNHRLHKANLSPSLGGEIRLAQLKVISSMVMLIIDEAVIDQTREVL